VGGTNTRLEFCYKRILNSGHKLKQLRDFEIEYDATYIGLEIGVRIEL
jgi:hypothetical protein